MKSDFCGVNLRGQSFKGKNLSGADFSKADIRGVDFTNATLEGANFTGAKAGLQKRWIVGQGIAALFICFVLGVASALTGYFVGLYCSFKNLKELNGEFTPIPGLLAVGIVIALSITIICEGLNAQAIKKVAPYALGIAVASIVSFPNAKTYAIAGVGAGSGAVLVAVIGSVPFAVAGIRAVAATILIAVGGAIASAPVIKFAMETGTARPLDGSIAFIVAVAVAIDVLSLSFYMAWCALKKDARFEVVRKIKVWMSAVGGTSFQEANLDNANFTDATLRSTDFRNATVKRTCWLNAKQTDRARWGDTILIDPDVRELLVTGHGRSGNYTGRNLKEANLAGANLRNANLSEADISGATLEGTDLEGANLIKTQALGVDFSQAILNGACIEAWNIDKNTKLDGAICQYVYLQRNQGERRPQSGEFAPGEFTKLFQETLDTIDLIFSNGLDWRTFKTAFDKVRIENEEAELSVKSIEDKGDGVVVVRVNVPPDADKAKLHAELKQMYEEIKLLKADYQTKLSLKDEFIASLVSRPTTIFEHTFGDKIMGDKYMDKVTKKTYNFNGSVTGFAENVEGNQNNFVSEQRCSLAEAAQEIQQLLKQLEANNPNTTEKEKLGIVAQAAEEINNNPRLKTRVISALKAGGTEAFKEAVDHPLVNILLATIEGWQEAEELR